MVEATQPPVEKSGITAAAAARIAKKNGAAKIGKEAALVMAKKAEEFIAKTTKDAVAVANHAGRKVIRAEDIDFVVK